MLRAYPYSRKRADEIPYFGLPLAPFGAHEALISRYLFVAKGVFA